MSTSSGDNDSSIPVASSSSSKGTASPLSHTPGRDTPPSLNGQSSLDLAETLDCVRMLLVPVAARQRQHAEKAAAEKVSNGNKKSLNINIPLHGPRVEIILAWLAAVHLVELESVA